MYTKSNVEKKFKVLRNILCTLNEGELNPKVEEDQCRGIPQVLFHLFNPLDSKRIEITHTHQIYMQPYIYINNE